MRFFHYFCLISLLAFSRVASAEVVLTITGDIEAPNRGARDDFRDSMFKSLNIPFERAREITLEEIKSLPQHTLEVQYKNWPQREDRQPHLCEGPTLEDVVNLAKPKGKVFMTQALDGYKWQYDRSTTDFSKVLVAYALDGRELAIGGRGPLMLCLKPGTYQGQSTDTDAGLAWALFHIQVKQ